MGAVIVFFLLAVVVAAAVMGVVAAPHIRSARESAGLQRHTSRTQRAGS